MNRFIKICITTWILAVSASANSAIVTGTFDTPLNETVVGDSGWLNEDTFGDALDFFVFEIDQSGQATFQVTSDIAFGLSLYLGEIVADFAIPFDNDADFTDLFSDLAYIGGVSALLPGFGNDPYRVTLDPGTYTLAAGGAEGFFNTTTEYAYSLTASIVSTKVSEPETLFLVLVMMLGIIVVRRHQQLSN